MSKWKSSVERRSASSGKGAVTDGAGLDANNHDIDMTVHTHQSNLMIQRQKDIPGM